MSEAVRAGEGGGAPAGMRLYLAPLEGITGYIYRSALQRCFAPADRCFTPFIVPKQGCGLSHREREDILPRHNEGMELIPQILTNSAEGFLRAADELALYGYREVNLNLGCPSSTVAAKGRGAGFLGRREQLEAFLDAVCEGMEARGMRLSIKTRLGVEREEEFASLLALYNRYPLTELIIHARVLRDYYGGAPRMEAFLAAAGESRAPICYNGDLFTAESLRALQARWPQGERAMLGRGVLSDPGLIERIRMGKVADYRARLLRFHALLIEGYRRTIPGERNVLFKVKELWCYLGDLFEGGESYKKQLKKTQRLGESLAAAEAILRGCPLRTE